MKGLDAPASVAVASNRAQALIVAKEWMKIQKIVAEQL